MLYRACLTVFVQEYAGFPHISVGARTAGAVKGEFGVPVIKGDGADSQILKSIKKIGAVKILGPDFQFLKD